MVGIEILCSVQLEMKRKITADYLQLDFTKIISVIIPTYCYEL